jgi:hypothetical protein
VEGSIDRRISDSICSIGFISHPKGKFKPGILKADSDLACELGRVLGEKADSECGNKEG